jgi:hypothetical protein
MAYYTNYLLSHQYRQLLLATHLLTKSLALHGEDNFVGDISPH